MKKLYPDRGMMKWQGLILSEHRELLAEMFESEKIERKKNLYSDFDEQEQEIFDRIVYTSFQFGVPVEVEVNTFDEPIYGFGVVKSLQQKNGRLELSDGSFCVKDIVSIRLADG